MPGFWEALGQGLETAGGVLSPEVYSVNQQQRAAQQQRQFSAQIEQMRLAQERQQRIDQAISSGALPAGTPGGLVPGMGPSALTRQYQNETDAEQKIAKVIAPFLEKNDYRGALAAASSVPGAFGTQSFQRLATLAGIQEKTPTTPKTGTQYDEKDIEGIAKAIAEYRQPPLTGYALRSPGAQKLMARVMELNPKYDARNYQTSQRTANAFAVGQEGRTVRSFNVGIDHLDTLNQVSKELENGNTKRANQLYQRIAEEVGSPIPTNFDAVKGIVAKEINKAIVAGGGGVTERQALDAALSRANNYTQLSGMIHEYQVLMAGQLKGLRQQYEGGYGPGTFDRFLRPRSKEIFDEMGKPPAKANAATAGEYPTATNDKGEKLIYKDGQWQPTK